MSDLLNMPADIVKAAIKVKGAATKLVRDARNPSGGFNYVSKDAFFEMIRPLEAEAGLLVIANEQGHSVEERNSVDRYGNKKTSQWLSIDYELYIYHESGAAFGPVRRTATVLANGPQAFGSAQAYVEKYFACNLYKIPTGEADADAHEQDGLPQQNHAPAPPEKEWRPTTSATMLIEALDMARTMHELEEWGKSHAKLIQTEDEDNRNYIRSAFARKKTQLREEETKQAAE